MTIANKGGAAVVVAFTLMFASSVGADFKLSDGDFIVPDDWYIMETAPFYPDPTRLAFRKFSLFKEGTGFDRERVGNNILTFVCVKDSKKQNYLNLTIPTFIIMQTLERQSWISKTVLRVKLDRTLHRVDAEYSNGEFFIDWSNNNDDFFKSFLSSKQAVFEFGPEEERITIYRRSIPDENVQKMGGFLSDVIPKLIKDKTGGSIKRFSEDELIPACNKFQKTGRF